MVFQDCPDWSTSLEVVLFHDFPPGLTQSITPASDETSSIVIQDSNLYKISGRILSKDGTKLFKSFQEFGLHSSQIANFLPHPEICHILRWVVGGDPSLMNGLIQITGKNYI